MYTKTFYVYIMTNTWNTTFYISITCNLQGRVWQHKTGFSKGFTRQYYCTKLVFFEQYDTAMDAIRREKQLKNWHREWKINLIREQNPDWKDLAGDWFDKGDPEKES